MTVNPLFRNDEGPTACSPSPAVLEDIQRAIKRSHAISEADVKLAAHMGLLGANVEQPIGLDDGVIYPRSGIRIEAAPASHPLRAARMARAAGQPRKLHAVAFLVDFSDNKGVRPAAEFHKLLFDPDNPDSFVNYYRDVSYGMLQITGEVIDWIRAPRPYTFYTAGASGRGLYPNNSQGLLEDVLVQFCKTDNLKRFDEDGDGYVDGIFLIHAGKEAGDEPDANKRKDMIWSHKWTFLQSIGGKTVYAYSTEPEDGELSVFAHEFGHVLGLPDLYDTSARSVGVGGWCLMGDRSPGGYSRPVRLSCWCLSKLGWIEPVEAESKNYVLEPLAVNAGHCLRVWTGGDLGPEYFLLENRQATGRDSALQGSGLAIWHIDQTIGTNANPPTLMVGLVQSSGKPGVPTGNVLFPGAGGKSNFNKLTTPSSSYSHAGTPTGVSLSKISIANGNVTVVVKR